MAATSRPPSPGTEKICSTIREPVIRPTIRGARAVMIGVRVLRRAWRQITEKPERPFVCTKSIYSELRTDSSSVFVNRVMVAMVIIHKDTEGSTVETAPCSA